jgi:nucleoside-diphosphate-sugar epimerase
MNIACGERYSLNQLLRQVGECTGKPVTADYRDARPGDVRDSQADFSLAGRILGYTPNVRFEEGLRETSRSFAGG